MVSVVLGMLFCVGLALGVVALVAVPARRAGRDVLTERGEAVVGSFRERQFHSGRAGSGAPEAGSFDDAVSLRG